MKVVLVALMLTTSSLTARAAAQTGYPPTPTSTSAPAAPTPTPAPAPAPNGYPPATSGYPPGPGGTATCSRRVDLGAAPLNRPVTRDVGTFVSNTSVELRVNNRAVGSVITDGSGCARVTVLVTSPTTATVNGVSGIALRTRRTNVVAIAGPDAAGTGRVATIAFRAPPAGTTASSDHRTAWLVVMWSAIAGAVATTLWGVRSGVRARRKSQPRQG